MDRYLLFYIFVLLWTIPFSFGGNETGRCMLGLLHKEFPEPDHQLIGQCEPWRNRTCCEATTTIQLHGERHHNFTLNHCLHERKMSDECYRHFIQDSCFYECSPNVDPWIVAVDGMKVRSERFYKVPLCRRDCELWYAACKDEFTCSSNWLRGFDWSNGTNVCKSPCFPYKDMFLGAADFCEKVWDDSWKVVDDSEPCMTLWVDVNIGNPNDKVAEYYRKKKLASGQSETLAIRRGSLSITFIICIFLLFS